MIILSASNVCATKERSQSLELAKKAQNLLSQQDINTEIIDLRNCKLDFCTMCQCCSSDGICVQNDDFNKISELWKEHDEILIICPHYAGIPSKLIALLEKIEEMTYLHYCQGKKIYGRKNAIIIAHGGMTDEYEDLYKADIIIPLTNLLKSIGCTVLNDTNQVNLCFGVKKYYQEKEESGVCHKKENDEEKSGKIVKIAVEQMMKVINRTF